MKDESIQRFGTNPGKIFRQRQVEINSRIEDTCAEVGRKPETVRLLPVTKTVPSEILRHAFDAGLNQFAENKVQEAQEKSESLSDLSICWCMIGHLQTNKVKVLSKFANEFHALDSIRLAKKLNEQLEKNGRQLEVYVQVNTSGESSKYGLAPDAVAIFLEQVSKFENLNLRGLMTLALFSNDRERVRACFKLLRELRDGLVDRYPAVNELSMGMSGDFEDAIREGSNVVRIGQGIFGSRPTPDSHYWPNNVQSSSS